MQILQYIAMTVLGCMLVGCGSRDQNGKKEHSDSVTEESESDTMIPSSRDATVPLGPIGLVDEKLHREPKKDPWEGEVFNELASVQLKMLGDLMKNPQTITDADLSNFTGPGFKPTSLVPKTLAPVFDDLMLTVSRPTASANNASPPKSLNEALLELVNPMKEATGLHIQFKTFSVSLDKSGEPASESYLQISGRSATGIISRKARWSCLWNWPSTSDKPKLKAVTVSEFEQSLGKTLTGSRTLFSECTGSVFSKVKDFDAQLNRGTDYWAARLESRYGIGLSGWHGMALGDVNGDGLDDLYVCEPGGLPNRLFIAKADGTVFDASSLSGTDFRLQTQSALFLDMDNDGDQDLILATTLGIIFMANDGRANFTVKATKLIPESAPMSLSAADFDLDGDLDVYVGCYSLRRSSSGGDGIQILGRPIPYHDANNGGRNVLLRNELNWQFTNVTLRIGMDKNNRRFTLAASWEDYDDDGDPDLYVANDYGRNNLYRNERDSEGNTQFVDVAAEAGVEDMSAGMSVSWSDADGDGDRDLYVSNMWSSAGNRIAYQRKFQSGADQSSIAGFQRHARGNSLFLNSGNGTFKDVSVEAGVTMGRWAWGSRFADINNDGRKDILVANGFITQPEDSGDL